MNKQLESRYYHADNSREAIELFNKIKEVLDNFSNKKIELSEKYLEKINEINKFIKHYRGTTVPSDFEKILIIEIEPIFFINTDNKISKKEVTFKYQPIGEGSYSTVYKYTDEFYNKNFVVKRAKSTITKKDLERFRREFEITKELSSPYIVEVYTYNSEKNEYLMEHMDFTLFDFISEKNSTLNYKMRFFIINQIMRAFLYLEEKKILHRDISPKNILLKNYDHTLIVKIADFGLVKIEDSLLTNPNTECRGSLNDPKLKDIGFKEYGMLHETYALTRLIAFVLSGKSNFSKIKDENILIFLNKGVSDNLKKRYQNINELIYYLSDLRKKLSF